MSTGRVASQTSRSTRAKSLETANLIPPPPTLTPENPDRELEPCAATASYLLYAQRNLVLCLHHDTLAIERRFTRHREDVRWISADTVSERGAGRLAVSYDAGHTAIVWDIATGEEIARFAAYEEIRVATWMRNGNIAFGNVQGNIILFEPSTSEHISARTIYDPITAIAPVADNRTFAIGYLNGSILIATLQPFTMVHSLNTSNAPSRVTGLAWHGSATRQKSDMLATQTADGNLKVWSIPKTPNGDMPNIIRILNRPDNSEIGPCWFAWSKLGRIIQHSGGETRSWDVRTKHVTYDFVPTPDGIVGMSNCGPTSTLFTLGSNHMVHQFDIKPGGQPLEVASVRHAPSNTPPSPPNSIEEQTRKGQDTKVTLPTSTSSSAVYSDMDTSESEDGAMSPLQRIANEMAQLEDERRDHVGPLSPSSSRASSVSSIRSSESGRRAPSYRYDGPQSSQASFVSADEGTEFSFGQPKKGQSARDSGSVRSITSFTSSKYRSSGLRKEVLRSPDEVRHGSVMDLFPFVRARLASVPFRAPAYGNAPRNPDVLRREMLSIVFGWNDDIEMLVRDELSHHVPASTSGVLLSQWLGELGANAITAMVGSGSMTSADWMLLALSTVGHGSQKKVVEAFVHRLLEKDDIHPAAAILIGLGDENDAIEVYVSSNYYLEAVLLTCLVFPQDWQRQSHLVRKWGGALMAQGQPALAVRCFSCTSVDVSDAFLSPRAQNSVYTTRSRPPIAKSDPSPPQSPPSATDLGHVKSRNASLRLITSFGEKGVPLPDTSSHITPVGNALGVTPIAESAISPGGSIPWLHSSYGKERDPSSARTATPGGYGRKRLPSKSARYRAPQGTPRTASNETPMTAARTYAPPVTTKNSMGHAVEDRVLSSSSSDKSQTSESLQDDRRTCEIDKSNHLPSPARNVFDLLKDEPKTQNGSRERLPTTLQIQVFDTRHAPAHSVITGTTSVESSRMESINLEDPQRESGTQATRNDHEQDQVRLGQSADYRGRSGIRYIRPAKLSPTSPIPMSPEEVAAATRAVAKETASPFVTQTSFQSPRAERRATSRNGDRVEGHSLRNVTISKSQPQNSGSIESSSAASLDTATSGHYHEEAEACDTQQTLAPRSLDSQTRDYGSFGAAGNPIESQQRAAERSHLPIEIAPTTTVSIGNETLKPDYSQATSRDQHSLARKRLAARELEERRASLARRPSAPMIPLPGQSPRKRPTVAPRFHTELGDSPNTFVPSVSSAGHERSHTADPYETGHFATRTTSTSGSSAPIGLPATPRAMRHPLQMGSCSKDREIVSAVPHGSDYDASMVETPSDETSWLPSTVFGLKTTISPQRAASVPIERSERNAETHSAHRVVSPSSPARRPADRAHSRRVSSTAGNGNSPTRDTSSPFRASIDETLHEASVVVVEAADSESVMLPELMHLATPLPPPPPPLHFPLSVTSSVLSTSNSDLGVINIAMDEDAPMIVNVGPTVDREAATSPSSTRNSHRRGRDSVGDSAGQSLPSATRMRSTSRSKAKSPVGSYMQSMLYETAPPRFAGRRESISRTKSPYEPSLGVTPVPDATALPEDISLPPSRSGSAFQKAYRLPKEVRANVPPETLQRGVYRSEEMK